MSKRRSPLTVAVVGAGIAGAACAAGLQRAGLQVTLFDKSRGVGGRMATRRVRWTGDDGRPCRAEFDHGAQLIAARSPRFRALLARAGAAGLVAPWQPRVHADWPVPFDGTRFVALPGMPGLARYLLGDLPVLLEQNVQGLQRHARGWQLMVDGAPIGPFDQVVLALPPRQAAALLAGHHPRWAEELGALRMEPCWTLMAVTDDVDWPWDAAEPSRGPLGWVARNDRKPGRSAPPGCATWVAHATPAWSAAHLEEDPAEVATALGGALEALLPPAAPGRPLRWHHRAVHRWRHALPADHRADAPLCWWSATRSLGVCGDALGGPDVEGAWRSGDELADRMAAELEERLDPVAVA